MIRKHHTSDANEDADNHEKNSRSFEGKFEIDKRLFPKKSLGQNFLLDLNLTTKIARVAGPLEGVTVVEIGPGPGGLTRALLASGVEKVIAVEKDTRAVAALQAVAAHYPGRLEIIEADAVTFDAKPYVQNKRARIIANLPYNVATPLLTNWLTQTEWPPWFDSMVLMFQKEVADRIVAPPGSKTYGRLSVLAQAMCEARIAFDLPPQAFTPPPKVTSSVVWFKPKTHAADVPRAILEKVTQAAFGQRRKMLRASLKSLGRNTEDLLAQAGIEPTDRAEQISVEGFLKLARLIEAA
ncbi:MAG: 16S rRNA (adenine(1518)-N(6)/adenine(1519)-N(6))-dimethyltransferase RsmA [Pseudomonadota bacterium]